jgi:hypothetical protein
MDNSIEGGPCSLTLIKLVTLDLFSQATCWVQSVNMRNMRKHQETNNCDHHWDKNYDQKRSIHVQNKFTSAVAIM